MASSYSLANFASWIHEEDKIPLQLALSMYTTPINELSTYILVASTARVGIWKDDATGIAIVATRGTKVGHSGGSSDVADDKVGSTIVYNFAMT